MSNLENLSEVDALRNHFADTLTELMMVNRYNYGIKNHAMMSTITGKLIESAHLSLKRAYLEGDKRFLRSSHQEISQTIKQGDMQKKPSWMSWLNK